MTFRFLEPAIAELDEAADFYKDRSLTLGAEFVTEIENAVARILEFPEAWSILSGDIRRCPTRRFPYFLVYSVVDSGEILIISVFHQHRHTASWQDNLK